MNNKGQVTKVQQSGIANNLAPTPATNGVKNVKQSANNVESNSNNKMKKKGTNKAKISNAKAGVTYATIGCQTVHNYGTPNQTKAPPAQASNYGPGGKGCAEKKSRKNKSIQTQRACKNQSNQTKKPKELLEAQPDQSQTKQNAQQAGKQEQSQTDKHKQTHVKPNGVKQQQPSQQTLQANHNGRSPNCIDDGQARFEASVKVNMSTAPQKAGAQVKKYTQEQLLAQMAILDMNNNQPPEMAKLHSDGRTILSNIRQLELRAELLVNSVPFRMPNSS